MEKLYAKWPGLREFLEAAVQDFTNRKCTYKATEVTAPKRVVNYEVTCEITK
nr:hypothetical protein [Candidatus Mycoplasma haematolamae]